MLNTTQIRALTDLASQYRDYMTAFDLKDAISNGYSEQQFEQLIMRRISERHNDASSPYVGMSRMEARRYNLGAAIRAAMTYDWSDAGYERECSRAVEKLVGKTPEGFFVPWDVLRRDFNVSGASEAGSLVATDQRSDLLVDALRANLVVGRLGATILTGLRGDLDLPKLATGSSVGMLTEIQAAAATNPATGKVSLAPKRVGAYVDYSKQALIQSAPELSSLLRDDLVQASAVLLEDQMLNGSGTGAEMRGVRNTSGIGAVVGGTNGAAISWQHLLDLEYSCASSNAEPNRFAGYIINPKTRKTAKSTQKSAGLPFLWDASALPLNGYRAGVTTNVRSNLTKGTSTTVCSSVLFGSDWSSAVLGLFGSPDIVIDPATRASTGQIRITMNIYADAGFRQPSCFSVMDDALTP